MSEKVDFWFDPSCPWTWITSRWILEAAELRDLDLTFRSFSIWELNLDKEISESYRAHLNEVKLGGYVSAGIEQEQPEKLAQFYTELGTRYYLNQEPKTAETIRAALVAVGLEESFADRAEAGEFEAAAKASTEAALAKVGKDVGVPIIAMAGTAFFGPVLSRAPKGEDAAKLWDGALAVAQIPDFYELKRTRNNVSPQFD
ncbi:MAG: disulfide bond formation protein DsbA [Arcanobacterium sp.]|nr:disulfide bond formation protein DsbA [Arcanobacterium sp.]